MAEMKWISVKDKRKPPMMNGESISVPVLLYVPEWQKRDSSGIRMGAYLGNSRTFRPDGSSGWEDSVTHWMPLPDPPQKETE